LAPALPRLFSPNRAGFKVLPKTLAHLSGRPYILMAILKGLQFGQRREMVWPDEFHAFEPEIGFHDYA